MSNKNSNFPGNQLNSLGAGVATDVINKLEELRKPKVATDEEFDNRVTEYLKLCAERDIRIGIEGLCLYLGISRTTLWKWCKGVNCSEHRAESARMAKQIIAAFLEQLNLSGRLNPASAIFYLKNWCGYVDSIDIKANAGNLNEDHVQSIEQIQERYRGISEANNDITSEQPEPNF